MTRTDDQFNLRMPPGMRPRLAEVAKANLRSMNAEIVFHLANALSDRGETAAGASPEKATPAAAPNETGSRPSHSPTA